MFAALCALEESFPKIRRKSNAGFPLLVLVGALI